jgi:hypothetical protein
MVMVAMMHGQFLKISAGKFSAASPADPGVHLQRFLAVAMASCLTILPGFSDYLIQLLF